MQIPSRSLLPAVSLILVAVLAYAWYNQPSATSNPSESESKTDSTQTDSSESTETQEEVVNPYPCPESWSPYVAGETGLVFCSPVSYGEAMEYGASEEIHVTFAADETLELIFFSDSAEAVDGDSAKLVEFDCLTDTASDRLETCFDSTHRVETISRFALASGDDAYEAQVEVQLLTGTETYKTASFILIPSVLGTKWDLEIAVPDGHMAEARELSNYLYVEVAE